MTKYVCDQDYIKNRVIKHNKCNKYSKCGIDNENIKF